MSIQEWTRLAPSPTGALHLGNAFAFVMNWLLARHQGWGILLRIEDLDTPRTKTGADKQAMDDLTWLGLDWDEGPVYQMHDMQPYRDALETLREKGLIYPCHCSRKDIEAASAPQQGAHEIPYPGTCAERSVSGVPCLLPDPVNRATDIQWRFRTPQERVIIHDRCYGSQCFNPAEEVGDFTIATKMNLPAYQLAVVVDDARQNITHVVRGHDLLASAARQQLLYRALDLTACTPEWYHLPLITGEDGRRLAKRHGDTRIASFRESGTRSENILGLCAFWAGWTHSLTACSLHDLQSMLEQHGLWQPATHRTFTATDHQWLVRSSPAP